MSPSSLDVGRHGVLIALALLVSALACSSSPLKAPDPFPFTGQSCLGSVPSCWQCVEDECPAAAQCIRSTCGAFWSCLCDCRDTDQACLSSCVAQDDSTACAQCGDTITTCGATHCTTECRGSAEPVLSEQGTTESFGSCSVGFLYLGAISGAHPDICTSARYRVNDIDFPCASCRPADIAVCKAQVQQYCAANVDGGSVVDAAAESGD